jgi:hypothetical protein
MSDHEVHTDPLTPTLAVVPFERPASSEHPAGSAHEVPPERLIEAESVVAEFIAGRERCHAKAATGGACGQPVVGPGASVCRIHGGSAPQVRQAAIERLKIARDSGLDKLIAVLSSKCDGAHREHRVQAGGEQEAARHPPRPPS